MDDALRNPYWRRKETTDGQGLVDLTRTKELNDSGIDEPEPDIKITPRKQLPIEELVSQERRERNRNASSLPLLSSPLIESQFQEGSAESTASQSSKNNSDNNERKIKKTKVRGLIRQVNNKKKYSQKSLDHNENATSSQQAINKRRTQERTRAANVPPEPAWKNAVLDYYAQPRRLDVERYGEESAFYKQYQNDMREQQQQQQQQSQKRPSEGEGRKVGRKKTKLTTTSTSTAVTPRVPKTSAKLTRENTKPTNRLLRNLETPQSQMTPVLTKIPKAPAHVEMASMASTSSKSTEMVSVDEDEDENISPEFDAMGRRIVSKNKLEELFKGEGEIEA